MQHHVSECDTYQNVQLRTPIARAYYCHSSAEWGACVYRSETTRNPITDKAHTNLWIKISLSKNIRSFKTYYKAAVKLTVYALYKR